ncbi:MAG: N-acetyl-gamma-glutamyl-phosphate reductase [Gemmatimonadetes bacterium]|nr:N-acetyl-gamma-glutamyl-phosphate reductase [Gemmatimonadota bacterium]
MVNISRPTAVVLGATGYTGQELVRLLRGHPRLALAHATSESEAGQRVPGTELRYERAADVALDTADVVFACLPHGESAPWSMKARAQGARVVDLSADLRAGAHGAVYGVPELWRDCIRGQSLVANPGCYPTGILLALAPFIRSGLLDGVRPVIIDAASGVTGAGRAAKREYLFGEVSEDYRAYAVGNSHRHVPEIAAGLARLGGGEAPQFVFTPHLLPIRRGILETMHVPVEAGVTADAAREATRALFADEPCVEVLGEGLPSLRDSGFRNTVSIGFAEVKGVREPLVLCVAAFDNLMKGAAGQALQNANLMLGLPELDGISA